MSSEMCDLYDLKIYTDLGGILNLNLEEELRVVISRRYGEYTCLLLDKMCFLTSSDLFAASNDT
jgi:hypothetical protein